MREICGALNMSRSDGWDDREAKWDGTSSRIGEQTPSNSITYWQRNYLLNKHNEDAPEPIDFLCAMRELANLQLSKSNEDVNMICFERTDTGDSIQFIYVFGCWYVVSDWQDESVYETKFVYVARLTNKQTSTIARLWFEDQPWTGFVDAWRVWRANTDGKLDPSDLIGDDLQ